MDSELSNEAGNEFKILGPLIKDTKLLLQRWALNGKQWRLYIYDYVRGVNFTGHQASFAWTFFLTLFLENFFM